MVLPGPATAPQERMHQAGPSVNLDAFVVIAIAIVNVVDTISGF